LIFVVLACTLPSIMRDSVQKNPYAAPRYPASKTFVEDNVEYVEYFYSSGEFQIMWCGSVEKWKGDWMPKGYEAQLTFGSDRTTHDFRTLGEAEQFLFSHGCPQ